MNALPTGSESVGYTLPGWYIRGIYLVPLSEERRTSVTPGSMPGPPPRNAQLALLGEAPSAQQPAARPVFARHNTFHPRHGWLKKGFDAAARDPDVFVRADGPQIVGVGKNMLRAIRYWGHAFKVLENRAGESESLTGSHPASLGRRLLSDDGLDPFGEDLGSLWLLHWHLLLPPSLATAWHFAFFEFARNEFTVDDAVQELVAYTTRSFPGVVVAESSVRKDISCVVRMYGERASGVRVSEESIQCPFADLGLLRPGVQPGSYAFHVGPKPGLTAELIAAFCCDFARRLGESARTVSLSKLLRGPGSPGMAFKIDESTLYTALERTSGSRTGLSLSDAAGVVQLAFAEEPAIIAERLLSEHFASSGPRTILV